MERKANRKARIGLYTTGLKAYWPQFAGLQTHVRRLQLRLFLTLIFAACTSFGTTLLDVDFTADVQPVDVEKVGTFHGVLPKRLNENFTGWCDGRVTGALMEEGGRRFLRLATRSGSAGGQFCLGGFRPEFPGYFRLRVTSRSSSVGLLTFGLRLHGAPYTTYASHAARATAWREETFFFQVSAKRAGETGLYLYTGPGTVDLAHLTLETATEADLAAVIPRPAKTVTDYVRHPRFPLGLPATWNLGRETREVTCGPDAATPAPDGVATLKLATPRPWEIWGEAFQTAYPGDKHTLVFRYWSENPAQVAVIDDKGRWAGNRQLPATTGWQEARLVFRAPMLSEAFGLRFRGEKGVFRLDEVHVFPGEGDRPAAAHPCQAVLAMGNGEIADDTRIQFTDEPFEMAFCALGAQAGDRLRVTVADLYGRIRDVGTFPIAGVGQAAVRQTFVAPAELTSAIGQFRFTAWVERDGRRVSLEEEFVMTRLARPVAWNRDAPDSPFGCHFNPTRSMVRLMKAGGVNWVRLHDAGEWVSGWHATESVKGRWDFHDTDVATYRDVHLKIFAQLGTAPAWATHFGDLGYTRLGYFEKYLRPTNTVDWATYVTKYVEHHRANIDAYFVWNEPWGRWWKSAGDAKWYDEKQAGADFAALSKAAYEAVKKVDPKIRVSGFNTTAGETGRSWTADVLGGGAFPYCDLIDWHFYTPHTRGHRDEPRASVQPLAPIRAVHPDLGGKPVYMSEGQGASNGSNGGGNRLTGLYQLSVPWPSEAGEASLHLADVTARYLLSLLAEDTAKIFLYTAHGWQGLAMAPSFVTLVGADGFPHPTLVAHAQLARMVEGKRFVRTEHVGASGVAYVFSDGVHDVRAYSDLTKDEVLARKGLLDLYGNPVTPETCLPGTVVYAPGD